MKKKEKKIKYKLTDGQDNTVSEAVGYIDGTLHTDKEYITISGMGGSGKTFVTKYIIDKFKKKTVLGIAISWAAVGQLEKGLEQYCVTLAKALNKKSVTNKATGVRTFEIVDNMFEHPMIGAFDIIIIDECSMISTQDIKDIIAYSNVKAKIIMLGDIAQLPPINGNQEKSDTFDKKIIELDEVMRFKDPLTKLNLQYRDPIIDYFNKKGPLKLNLNFKNDKDGLFNVKNIDSLLRNFLGLYDYDNLGSCRIIAYTNDMVDAYNNYIRQKLFGDKREQLVAGDIIIATAPYKKGKIKNNETIKVIKSQKATFDGIKGYLVDIENNNKERISDVRIIDNDDYYALSHAISKLERSKDWRGKWRLKDSFLYYSYGFSSTSHKAQGSTINNIFVDVPNIMKVSKISFLEKAQSTYVGISRASERIFIYGL